MEKAPPTKWPRYDAAFRAEALPTAAYCAECSLRQTAEARLAAQGAAVVC